MAAATPTAGMTEQTDAVLVGAKGMDSTYEIKDPEGSRRRAQAGVALSEPR